DLNNNQKAAITVPAASLFLAGEKNLVDDITTPSGSYDPFRNFAQTWTEITYTSEAQYILTQYASPDNWWAILYGGSNAAVSPNVLSNLVNAKLNFPATAPTPGALKNDLIITDILEIYTYNLLVTTYGNIPYTQANNRAIPFPKYDDAKTVYADLLTRLDTCIAGLDPNSPAMGGSDNVYTGNVAAWKKFAATLKLKMAMLLADTDPGTASKKVLEAVGTGVFSSNADNGTFVYQGTPTGNANPVWQAAINSGRHDNLPANTLVDQMVSWNDPRLPLYFSQVGGGYKGGQPGAGNSFSGYSTFSSKVLDSTNAGVLLDYAETEFLLAEAVERGIAVGGTAADHYNAGVTASILYWGGSTTDAANYLAQPAVAYATAAGDYHQKIGYQQWISDYNRGWDAWTSIRRLGYPDINTINPPYGAVSPMPLRFYYPLTEQSANSTNYADAVKAMGGNDAVTTKLFWMK
ncbi:MAG TPA: SusD/RagB family nutrient-binding outer membrane lipoprotein, partial [Puia sp.]|nr:SusD/RagB family nutrient-binding outer membrane lipoprotein [Puia sp.]